MVSSISRASGRSQLSTKAVTDGRRNAGKPILLGLLAGFAALAALTAIPADAKVPGPNGRIAFTRFDPALGGTVTCTVNPDGSQMEQLYTGGQSEFSHWSPDGSDVSIFAPCTRLVSSDG